MTRGRYGDETLADNHSATSFVPTAVLIPGVAWSSACNEEVVVEIHMAEGDLCWDYRGNATTFVGKFAGGQNVEVRMSGESAQFDPVTKKDIVTWEARSPSSRSSISESLPACRNFSNRHLIGICLDHGRRALPCREESFDRFRDLA